MAGDEDKKKKKKSKKTEDVAPPAPVVEVEAEPAPPAAEPEPVEEAAPAAEGEAVPAGEGEEVLEPPPAPKKKPKFFVHWNRRKARFYDYNFDYGENYYSSMVKYMDTRASDVPRRMAFAERGIRSNLQRKTLPDIRTESLLADVRSSIRNFEQSQKTYINQSIKWELSKK